MKLLVTVSRKSYNAESLDIVARLAEGGSVTLLHVAEEEREYERPEEAAPALAETAGYLRGRGLAPEVKTVAGDATDVILAESAKNGHDMIVMRGHDRHPGLLTAMFGDTVTRVLERSTLPVLALRSAVPLSGRRVLLAAGRPSARVLDATAAISRAASSGVTVLHVLPSEAREDFLDDYLEAPSGGQTLAQLPRGIETVVRELQQRGAEAEAIAREGLVEEELVEEANSGRYWLVALRARPSGRLSRLFLGHTFAEDVVRHVGTNILMLR